MPRVEWLRHIVYPWADVVTANSKGALTALKSFVPSTSLRSCPIRWRPRRPSETVAFTAPTVITVGRLVEQKGHRCPACGVGKVVEALPEWRLALVGDGPLAGELKEQAREARRR